MESYSGGLRSVKDFIEKEKKYIIIALCVAAGYIFIGWFVGFFSSSSYPLIPHIALLYVGKDTGESVIRLEREIHDTVKVMREEEKIFPKDLNVVSYHFDRPGEREVCEQKFSIYEKDLPFLGVAEMDSKDIPTQILYRQKVVKGDRNHLMAIFNEARKMLKEGMPIGN